MGYIAIKKSAILRDIAMRTISQALCKNTEKFIVKSIIQKLVIWFIDYLYAILTSTSLRKKKKKNRKNTNIFSSLLASQEKFRLKAES